MSTQLERWFSHLETLVKFMRPFWHVSQMMMMWRRVWETSEHICKWDDYFQQDSLLVIHFLRGSLADVSCCRPCFTKVPCFGPQTRLRNLSKRCWNLSCHCWGLLHLKVCCQLVKLLQDDYFHELFVFCLQMLVMWPSSLHCFKWNLTRRMLIFMIFLEMSLFPYLEMLTWPWMRAQTI